MFKISKVDLNPLKRSISSQSIDTPDGSPARALWTDTMIASSERVFVDDEFTDEEHSSVIV